MPNDLSIDETEGLLVETGKMILESIETQLPTFIVNTDAKINKV